MADVYTHDRENTAATTNALLAILLVIITLILGFFLFRNGFAAFQPNTTDQNIRVEIPTNAGGASDTTQNREEPNAGISASGTLKTP